MGARKDHITGMERAQIAIEMLPSYRPYGTVTQLKEKYEISRQAIYKIAEKGKRLLSQEWTGKPWSEGCGKKCTGQPGACGAKYRGADRSRGE